MDAAVNPSSAVNVPPTYSEPFANPDSSRPYTDSDNHDVFPVALPDVLPEYSPPAPSSQGQTNARPQSDPKEFYYELKRNRKTFATLTLVADGLYSKSIPTYVEGQPVKGRVQLSLSKPEPNVHSIVVVIRGQVITGPNLGEQLSFLEITHTVWSQADGQPLNTSAHDGNSSPDTQITGSQPTKFTGKLCGNYTWPFSIELPKEVVHPFGAQRVPQTFSLPQTFNERHTRASISYDISMQLMRGKLRTDHRIGATFGYLSVTRPPPFSSLRTLAYQEGSPLLGPSVDPEGWLSPEPLDFQVSVFNNRVAKVKSTLYLAKPLSYTRGSVIPLLLCLESNDEQAVDLLSSPKAIIVRLRRRIKYHWNSDRLDSLAWRDGIDYSQLAAWWPSAEESSHTNDTGQPLHTRVVNGELHLRADYKPTSAMAHFRLEYNIVLFPFDAPGIAIRDVTDKPMLVQPVEVVTNYGPGPRPKMYVPPGYESEAPVLLPTNVISTASMGFL